ncbi:MAG TPA: IS3 family transposase [Eubacteriaceae bacterium]|nr:IS3 family transposase [Eubacteriaceae bacterium]
MTRKKYSDEFKQQIVKEAIETGNMSLVARQHEIAKSMVAKWVKQYKNPPVQKNNKKKAIDNSYYKELETENDKLKKLLGEKDLEIAILKDLLKNTNPPIEDKVSIANKWISRGYKAVLVLKIVGLSRSTYYYRISRTGLTKRVGGGRPCPGYSLDKANNRISDEQIKEWLTELIADEGYAYGYLKLTYALKRNFRLIINKKKVYRLCKELEILRPQRKFKPSFPRKIAKNRVITGSNQLWEMDVKYGYIAGENRFFFLLSLIDVADRNIIDYHLGLSCTAEDAVRVVQSALLKRQLYQGGNKPVIRSDNGPQFISHVFDKACEELGIEHERIPFKTPNKNAHIEAFHRLLEDECFSRYEFAAYAEVYEVVAQYINRYNKQRLHSSIGYVPPEEFYKYLRNGEKVLKITV